ncbi:hypothetical protein PPYR_11133 [Photinus pyralis]|uniref:Protein krueppel n=1 Tax=Photinus pyralis TaxID=7054 RepID=A0A5N4AAG3_PHOPY|nr:zinc finger protein OZF-like [Photinus pyralis]KAB0794294.1 hypothetical protein PPYR_11133 [Photinus pyralis]
MSEFETDDTFVVIKNIANVCRICLEESAHMISIHNTENELQKSVTEMITICMTIKLEERELFPELVCNICRDEIILATKLHMKFTKSQSFLYEHVANLQVAEMKVDEIVIINTISEIKKEPGEPFIVENSEKSEKSGTTLEKVDHIKGPIGGFKQADKTVLCTVCNVRVPPANIKAHLSKHSKVLECPMCCRTFANNFNLRRHMYTHTNQTPFECGLCGIQFSRKDNLVKHIQYHSLVGNVCTNCGQKFESLVTLQQHVSDKSNCQVTKFKRLLSCDVCFKTFGLVSSLNTHKLLHTPNTVICQHCGNPYPNEKKLKSHIEKVHQKENERLFLCNVCAKQYKSKVALDTHMATHEDADKKYECKVCEKRFAQASSLSVHHIIHTDEKPYVCHICSRGFNKSCNLYRHIRTHSDNRPHQCNYCKKTFRFLESLTIHIRTHTGEKPFACLKCDKRFADRSTLCKHKKLHLKTDELDS